MVMQTNIWSKPMVGAGAVEIAKTLQYHRCGYLAVAVASEGVTLRDAGITIPIIILIRD